MQENIRNTQIDVGTSPVVISEEQDGTTSERSVIVITNISTSTQVITISPADEAQATKGIPLNVGGWYCDSAEGGYKPTQRRITAISSAAGGSVSVHERVQLK